LSASAPSSHDLSLAAFTINIAESNFRHTQAEKLVEAGQLLAREPRAMQLRYFEALHDIASERSSTIVFPLPTDLLSHLAPRSDGAE